MDSIKIQRSYKFRCIPNRAQQKQLAIEFGHARWVWNQCLAWRTHAYKEYGEQVTAIDFSRALTFLKQLGTYDWLKDASATCLAQKLRDQDVAFRNFFAGRAKHPRFKKRTHAQSVRYQLDQRQVEKNFSAEEHRLSPPKLGQLKLKWSRSAKTLVGAIL